MNATGRNLAAVAREQMERESYLAPEESNAAALEARGIGQGTPVDKFYRVSHNPWRAMPECFPEDQKEDW